MYSYQKHYPTKAKEYEELKKWESKQKNIKDSGVYKIENIINHKVYIGSSKNMQHRRWIHFNDLTFGKHPCTLLQKDYTKGGRESFKFIVLERCPEEKLHNKEQYWIEAYMCLHFEIYNKNLSVSYKNSHFLQILKSKIENTTNEWIEEYKITHPIPLEEYEK